MPQRIENDQGVYIAIDSEWDDRTGWLASGVSVKAMLPDGTPYKRYFIYCSTHILPPMESPEFHTALSELLLDESHELIFVSDFEDVIPKVLQRLPGALTTVTLRMFYSPKDLEYALGWGVFREAMLHRITPLQQKRCVKGEIKVDGVTLVIHDLRGWGGSLKSLADSVGVDMVDKGSMDDYKSRMLDGFRLIPETARAYMRGDCEALHEIVDAQIELVRWVQGEIIGLEESDWFDVDTIPHTTGALVAKTFERWLHSQGDIGFALNKLGIVKQEYSELFESVVRKGGDRSTLKARHFDFSGLSQCSVGYFAERLDSSAFNALVQGGRCNNERPTEFTVDHGADIDLQGCYGNALRDFRYPLGLPRVWGQQPGQVGMTLKKFLTECGDDLVPGLWTITVSGSLRFEQDLIFSKIVTQKQINQAASGGFDKEVNDDDRDDDLTHIPGDFALIRKELANGIITDDVLNIIKAVATNQELAVIMNLTVVSAAAYLKCDEVDSVETWVTTVETDRGSLRNLNSDTREMKDGRTRAWVGVPIEGFVGRLVDERTRLKQETKRESDPETRRKLDAKQNALKLFVNTIYGDLASPYFPIGNTVVANNITARARVGTWMMNKALHTRQSITDGGIYSPREVPYLTAKARLPGFGALASNARWRDKDYTRVLKPLGGLSDEQWVEAIASGDETTLKQLDETALHHVNNFWSRWELSLPFKIEHKLENTFTKAAYFSKAHYCLLLPDGARKYKIRGAKMYTDDKRSSPMYQLLDNLVDGVDEVPPSQAYDHSYLLKMARWKQRYRWEDDWVEGGEVVTEDGEVVNQVAVERFSSNNPSPGDAVIEERCFKLRDNHLPVMTVAEFKNAKSYQSSKKWPGLFFPTFTELTRAFARRLGY